MLEKVRQKFINYIKDEFINLEDMKVIKKKIEAKGYITSRIYGNKNVKRLTATSEDKTRIEFILSKTNLHILFNLDLSNRLTSEIIVISRVEKEDVKEFINEKFKFYHFSGLYFYNKFYENIIDPKDVYLSKYNMMGDTRNYSNMSAINEMAHIREKLILVELDRDKLPLFSTIKERRRNTLVKNVADATVTLITYGLRNLEELDTIHAFENKAFFHGFVFYPLMYNSFQFASYELDTFFDKYVQPYILKNIEKYAEKHNKFLKEFRGDFKIEKVINETFFEDYKKDLMDRSYMENAQAQLNSISLNEDESIALLEEVTSENIEEPVDDFDDILSLLLDDEDTIECSTSFDEIIIEPNEKIA